jgi:hypothetical protein
MPGAWYLDEPKDLIAKMESDLARMRASPRDAHPAFDFFVTAHHLADWVERDDGRRRALIGATPLLLIAGAIANGSKHFMTSDPRWRAVSGLESGMRGPSGVGPAGIRVPLWVNLDEAMAARVPCASDVSAIDLAVLLLEWWKGKLYPP